MAERETRVADGAADVREWTGQLDGGPDDGNLITSTEPSFATCVTYEHWLNGGDAPSVTVVEGEYVWQDNVFKWHPRHTFSGGPQAGGTEWLRSTTLRGH